VQRRLLATIRHKRLGLGVVLTICMTLSLFWTDRPLTRCGFLTGVALAAENSVVESGSFGMLPGVVVDPAAEHLYLMNPHGGIDAVELASGNLLWTSQAAGKPLAVFDDRLAVQAEAVPGSRSLPIILLDTKSGRIVSSIAVPMPPGVMPPSIDDRMGTSSSVEARVEHDGLLVRWTLSSRGVSPIQRPVSVRNDSGATLINLQTLTAVPLTSDDLAEATLRSKTSSDTTRLSGTEGLYFQPRPAGGFLVSVKLGPASAGQDAVMKRWNADSGEPLRDIDLGPGFVDSSVSADHLMFLAIRRTPAGSGYLWSIYTIANGDRVAELRMPDSSAQSFFVWHSILIVRASDELHGVDLKTGTQIWTRALRDTSYRGSYPPHS
jgi:hypothetical protein